MDPFYFLVIYFKQISFHDIVKLDNLNLNTIDIIFQVSCRLPKQKRSNIIGCAYFNMGSFYESKFLSCNQELVVLLKQDSPINVGSVKVNVELGCGKLYFGNDFLGIQFRVSD